MANITGIGLISGADLYTSDTAATHALGELLYGINGKAFRYVQAGTTALVVGNVVQGPAVDTQFDDMTPGTCAAGFDAQGYGVQVIIGTSTVAANAFVGASLAVSVTPGLGEEYTVQGHTTGTSGGTLTFYLDRKIRTGWTSATRVTLRNLWSGVVQAPATTLTNAVAGVAIYALPASTYGWIQTKGLAAVLGDGSTAIVGSDVGAPGTVAGAFGVNVAGSGKSNSLGRILRANASGKTVQVYLDLD